MTDEVKGAASQNNEQETAGTVAAPVESVAVDTVSKDVAEPAPVAAVQATTGKKNNKIVLIVAAAVVAVLALIALLHSFGVISLPVASLVGPEDKGGAVVATVNNAKITRGELDERVTQYQRAQSQGAPEDPAVAAAPVDAAVEQQMLDELVSMKLLLNKGEEAGLTASDEEVTKEIESLVTMFGSEEAIDSQLAVIGMTRDQLRENIRKELIIRKVVDANTDAKSVSVSPQEIRKAYDENVAGTEGAPSFEEMVPFIEQQLTQQKTAVIVNDYVAKLRSEANVELKL